MAPIVIDAPHHPSDVRLSGKEIFGLAARVMSAAQMPIGCVGAAAEAIDFLEYFSGNGLLLLDRWNVELLQSSWRPPTPLVDTPTRVVCDALGESSLFAGPPLADWLAAMALEGGAASMAVVNLRHGAYLPSLAYRLVSQGLSCAMLFAERRAQAPVRVVAIAHGQGWTIAGNTLAGWPVALTKLARALSGVAANVRSVASFDDWHHQWAARPWDEAISPALQSFGLLCAVGSVRTIVAKDNCIEFSASNSDTRTINNNELSAARRHVREHGRPIGRDMWLRLMTFANRTLIPTSEQSRRGAG